MAIINEPKEVQIRFEMDEELHKKVQKVQGLFMLREGSRVSIKQVYIRLIERGLVEIMKQNRNF